MAGWNLFFAETTDSSEILRTSVFTISYSSTTTTRESSPASHATVANSYSSLSTGISSINITANGTSAATLDAEGSKPNYFSLPVVAGLSGACGFLFISNIVLLSLFFRTRWRKDSDIERKSKDTPEGECELPCSQHKYEDIEKTDHHGANIADSAISNKYTKKKDQGIETCANCSVERVYKPHYGSSRHKYEDVENTDHRGGSNEDTSLTETVGYESFTFSAVNPAGHYEVYIPNPNASH